MRGYGVAVSAVVSVLVLLSVSGPAASDSIWVELLPTLTSQLQSQWQSNELEFMGSTCYYTQNPQFYFLDVYYHGSFSCPTWSNIRGKAKTRTSSTVMVKTIEDYLTKARDRGLVTEEEFRVWREGYTSK